jgi:hypothetical protein
MQEVREVGGGEGEEGREEERKGGREEGREEGRKEGRKGGREEERKGKERKGREEGRKAGRNGGREEREDDEGSRDKKNINFYSPYLKFSRYFFFPAIFSRSISLFFQNKVWQI